MKSILKAMALIMCAVLLLSITGCNKQPEETTLIQQSTETSSTQQTESSATTTEDTEETEETDPVPQTTKPLVFSEGLNFEAIDKTTAKVTGLGTCTDMDIVIPEETPKGLTVVEIADKAFYESKITSVIIPESVTRIGNGAFRYCTDLESVKLYDRVSDIGTYAFSNCLNLTYFEMPGALTKISTGMFMGCLSLKSIAIPDSVTAIGSYAFRDCESLSHIDIPEGAETIGEAAFERCKSLVFVKVPESVTDLGYHAFASSGIESVQLACRGITPQSFYRCKKLRKIVIDPTVIRIECCAFSECESLTALIIPDTVEWIDIAAFSNCKALSTVVVPEYIVGSNKSEVFGGCSGIITINGKAPKDYFDNWVY